jgi:RecB family exonuclease
MLTHISYSQYNSYTSCPRSWYLSRLRGGEERQTWYIPIGTVTHEAVEARLKGEPFDITSRFYELVSNQMRIEPDLSKWLAGGPELAPITHDKALQRAVECFEKAAQELEAIEVWEVEYDASGSLPGLEVPIKAYIDIIGEHKKKGPIIWDWKTGSTKPGNFQLETYAALLRVHPRFKVNNGFQGRYVMLSPTYTSTTRHVDLSEVDPTEVGAKYQAVYDQMKAKIYRADAGFNCKFCFQAENCKANKGINPRTEYYDRSDEDGYPY